jgi:hypothetical protein
LLASGDAAAKPARPLNEMKVTDWLQEEDFNTKEIHTAQDILAQAANMLDGAEFCIDPASPDLVVEIRSP